MEEREFSLNVAALDLALQREGLLSTRYVAVASIVADQQKVTNDQRKSNREDAETILKGCGDAVAAVKVANALLPIMGKGADASERKRAQRRRDWLKARLTACFSQFDFLTDGSKLVAEFIGTASIRIAREWRNMLDKIVEYGLGLDATVEEMASVIAATERNAGTGITVTLDNDGEVEDMFAAIADKISGIQAKIEEAKREVKN